MSQSRKKEVQIDQDRFQKPIRVDFASLPGRQNRSCVGCGNPGKWRFITRDYVCDHCRHGPDHCLITRTTAKERYGLTFHDLHEAWKAGKIRMMTARNPHGPGNPPARYYYECEIKELKKILQ